MFPSVEGELEMALSLADYPRRSRRVEDSKDRVAEAVRIDISQFDVAAVAITRVGVPTLTDSIFRVRLSNVLAADASIDDEIHPYY